MVEQATDVPRIVGKVVVKPLKDVRPNPWNPNRMTPFVRASLKQGLLADGWLSSQSLLIWGKDDKGARQDLIIDGEHRWTLATELGFATGPMVFLDGLTEAKVKALTVKMNQKRGEFDETALATLLQEIQYDLGVDNLSLDLGIGDEELMKMLATLPTEVPLDLNTAAAEDTGAAAVMGASAPQQPGNMSQVKMVQLFFTPAQHEEFLKLAKAAGAAVQATNVSELVLEVLRRAASAT